MSKSGVAQRSRGPTVKVSQLPEQLSGRLVRRKATTLHPAKAFMVNYRVDDLHAPVKALREEGCNVLEKIDESEYGKFAWVIDPEGNKVELWQPAAGQ